MTTVFGTVATIIIHTPIWVWGLYALLLFLGVQRIRDSIVPMWRMLILPVVVTCLAIASFIGAGPSGLPAMLPGLVIGGLAGWQIERDGATRRLPDGTLWLRGEWWSLAQIALVLVFRYATSVVAAMYPVLNAEPTWHLGTLFVSAALSAAFLGRTTARLWVYRAAAMVAG
jgi:hypothetical protein